MKYRLFSKAFLLCLLIMTTPSFANVNKGTDPVVPERAIQLQHRLAEINAIDKTMISKSEKKVLRREVREIKKELAAISGGVYLSVGAIILIALLLILLL